MARRRDLLTILAVEDDALYGDALAMLLGGAGHEVSRAASLREAREQMEMGAAPDVVLLDVSLPDGKGTCLLPEIRSMLPQTLVLCVTAHLDVPDIVDAIRNGASDYILKTDSPMAVLSQIERHAAARDSNSGIRSGVHAALPLRGAAEVERLLRLGAGVSSTVLLKGETGTGKSYAARFIHAESPRASRPFITVDCAALSESLAESELFGHERGAFTGAVGRRIGTVEAAGDGTIFFDEIADLPMSLQGKLLRILDERVVRRVGGVTEHPVHARVIGATRRDLSTMVEEGRFREDLYFRLSVLEIPMLPLRNRSADVPALALKFLRTHGKHSLREVFTDRAIQALTEYEFPGNIRELRNVVERAVLMVGDGQAPLSAESLHMALGTRFNPRTSTPAAPVQETASIGQALVDAGGRIGDAAKHLGISRHALRRKLKKLQQDELPSA